MNESIALYYFFNKILKMKEGINKYKQREIEKERKGIRLIQPNYCNMYCLSRGGGHVYICIKLYINIE